METLDVVTRTVVPFAVAWCAALLVVRTVVVLRRGYRVELGDAKGSARRGVLYSLTFSMLPWKKDSTRRHAWTYLAGMAMHAGVFFALLCAAGLWLFGWPSAGVLAVVRPILAVLATAGFVATLGLFLKRRSVPHMQAISSPDDFVANAIVQLYLLGAAVSAIVPSAIPLWRATGILLLLYLPLGKIYHMLLFFVSRVLFGVQFGRRGVLKHDVPLSY